MAKERTADGEAFAQGGVRGYLHRPEQGFDCGVVLAHGAGSNASAPILIAACRQLSARGLAALRIDLPFRQQRPKGPPFPAGAARDREGLQEAAGVMRGLGARRLILGGHSYGGRQATMLAAGQPELASLLLLLAYPLHAPAKPDQLRTEHLPRIMTPCVFVHGTADPFGSVAEVRAAVAAIPAAVELVEASGAGHDLRKVPWEEVLRAIIPHIPIDSPKRA